MRHRVPGPPPSPSLPAVRAALIAGGVNPTRLTSSGYGATRPIGDNTTPEVRSKNRRAEIVVVRAKQ